MNSKRKPFDINAPVPSKYLIAFNMPRSMRRNIIRTMPGGINKLWKHLPLMKMQKKIAGKGTVMIGVRRMMPWEKSHV